MWQKYSQLSSEERYTIYELLQTNQTKREIAHILNRSASTITREIERNKTRIRYTHKTNPKYHYLPDSAQAHRNERRRQANYRTPLKNEVVKNFVFSHLKIWWSPDIISGVLRKKYGKCQKFNISHETIYNFIYKKENWGLNLKDFLLIKHKRRKQKTWKTLNKKSKIPNRLVSRNAQNYSHDPKHVKNFDISNEIQYCQSAQLFPQFTQKWKEKHDLYSHKK